jgi:hypothetical protein
MAKKKQSQSPAAKRARDRRALANAAAAGAPGLSGAGEPGKTPPSAKATKTDSENASEQSANAAAEVRRRRHEPPAPGDPDEDNGPDVGRVDNRVDTSFETQQMPRPARPLTATSAVGERIAPPPVVDGDEEEPLTIGKGFPKKVRAIRMGYLRHARRRAGDVFLIYNAREFSAKWMEYAGSSDPEKITTGQQELEKQRRESLEDKLAKKRAGTGDADVLTA